MTENNIMQGGGENMSVDAEIWKPIIYKDIKINMYEVSNFGRVRNCKMVT